MTTAKKIENFDDRDGIIDAINKVQAVIEFDLNGYILHANENFLNTVGYSLNEIKGKHHRIFCDSEYASSLEYKNFWKKLNEGNFDSGNYKRKNKEGEDVWINASYNPVYDDNGKVVKIVKFATDITESVIKNAEFEGKMISVDKAQAVIEFNLDGTILKANENFLKTVGYELDEIQGRHHKMFCSPELANSHEYQEFWNKLNRGEFDAGEYKRYGKGGKEIWIQASYNPILNADGKVFKVVKFATDITASKLRNAEFEGKMNAVDKAQAVIEFNLDGTIIKANDNFLITLGYSLDEIKGKHHKIFCEPEYTQSNEYQQFWKKLNEGIFDTGEYKRLGKGGKEIWIQASYNPIFNADGVVYKVVKFATDITNLKTAIKEIEKTADNLNSEALKLTNTAEEMNHSASQTSSKSETAAHEAENVSNGIRSVATNTDQMVDAIKEISRAANDSSSMSKDTLQKAQATNKAVEQLGVSSKEIGNVIKVISSIAQQTNLLALNATIEAARAGDAGKGFAVVANEVKELANQTATATEDITQKIAAIQKDSDTAIGDIAEIAEAMEKLNNIAGSIATAVEEQNATTGEVSRIISRSTESIDQIVSSIKEVSELAEKNRSSSDQTLSASTGLTGLSKDLKSHMEKLSGKNVA